MKKLFILLLLFISLGFSKTNVTLQLSWLNQFQFAGYYIAKEKGFYKDYDLNVEIKEFNHNSNIVNIIMEKKADFAIGRSSLLIDKTEGKDIVALAAIYQSSPLMLLTTNPTIKNIEDFKNKKIMITPDAENTASLNAMIKSNNILEKELNYIPHSFKIDDLISGKTDLMSSYVSNEPIRLDEKKIPYKIFHPKDYGFNFYSDILFTSKEFLENNPGLVKDFYDATIKGWHYAFEHKAETAEIIFNKYNTQNKSFMHLFREAEVLEKLALNEDGDIGCIDTARLQNIVDTFKTLGLIKETPNLEEFIYEGNHHNKFKIEISQDIMNILLITAFFIVIILLLIIYFINKMNNERKLLNMVLDSSEDLIFYKDKELKYLGCNQAFEKHFSLKEKEIIGKTDFDLFSKNDAQRLRDTDLKVLAKGKTQISDEIEVFNEKTIYLQSKKVPLNDEKIRIGILGISRDLTDLHEAQEKLKEIALTDELTKTFNRKAFNEKIKEEFNLYNRYKNVFCIAMLDIDDFKKINDTYGHDVGDVVLTKLCETIKSNIRNTDILYRMGGEEFLILYPETDISRANQSLEILMNKIRSAVMQQKNNIKIKVSVGLSQVNVNDNINSIYKRVDDNLYYSKQHGKDRITADKD